MAHVFSSCTSSKPRLVMSMVLEIPAAYGMRMNGTIHAHREGYRVDNRPAIGPLLSRLQELMVMFLGCQK